MSPVQRHVDHSLRNLFLRTISAQIHLIALGMAFIGMIYLLHSLYIRNSSPTDWVACLIFGLTSLLVFAASTVYHFLSDGFHLAPWLEKVLKDIDHFAIYLFIAGTYTPFLMNALTPPWSIGLLIVIWTTAISGILYTHFKARLPGWLGHRYAGTAIFLIMGWAAVARLETIFQFLSVQAIMLLVGGGLSYSLGALVYAFKWPRLLEDIFGFHELWHVMVMIGFGCHYFLILSFYHGTATFN